MLLCKKAVCEHAYCTSSSSTKLTSIKEHFIAQDGELATQIACQLFRITTLICKLKCDRIVASRVGIVQYLQQCLYDGEAMPNSVFLPHRDWWAKRNNLLVKLSKISILPTLQNLRSLCPK